MVNRKEKRIRKLKKNHAWLSIIIYIPLIIIGIAIIQFLVGQILYFIVQSKLASEYKMIEHMARIYERENSIEDAGKIFDVLDDNSRDYFIRDEKGSVLTVNGANTCGKNGTYVFFSSIPGFVTIYPDTEKGYIYADEKGSMVIDEKGIFKEILRFKSDNRELFEDLEDSDEFTPDISVSGKESSDAEGYNYEYYGDLDNFDDEDNLNLLVSVGESKMIRVPVWMSVSVKDGTEEFVGKGLFEINIADVAMLILAAILLALLAALVLIVMIVSAINGIISQRRMLKLFFTDMVTKGHNWNWFLFKGEHFLRKRFNAKNTYAVVNLVFVKYRNYCVCHSIEKGEKMLTKVYNLIEKRLERKEMLAHVSNSNFALLLKYDNEDSLKMRIQSIILELEKIDTDHVFSFQAGIDPINVQKNEKGRIVRRKNIDIELEYNNACTARATLSGNDDSGVAFFDDKLVEDQKWIDKVTDRQRTALENEEYVVYYQPKYDPGTDELRGAEALIRWQSPEMGFVSPGRFIPIFEKNGFITEIDHYMLEHVARDQKEWLDKGYKCVPISVNVSRAHFIEADLAEQIRDIVDKAGTPHKYIEIELTESAFFDDKKALIDTITRLKEYGFAVSMDDFGSGYSSLNSLKDMPLDVLKLDAEFFRGDSQGDRGEIVVSEAIKLAKSLNMRTVAEGVEVKEQVDFLAKQGCDMIQGYYYAKPMPKEDYEQRM